jgi:glycosyltransferase involved in cell wall biosynthesis
MLDCPEPISATEAKIRPVVMVSRGISAAAGGLEIFNANLVEMLRARGEVRIATGREGRLADYFARLTETARMLRADQDADVIVQYGSFLDILSLPWLRLFSARVGVIAHVSDSWKHVRNPMLFGLTRWIVRHCARSLFVLSEQQLEVFRALAPVKIHTIIGSTFATRPRASSSRRGFVFLGRVVEEKGIFDVVRAWADPRIAGRGLELRIVGRADAATTARLETLIAELGLGGLVRMAGPAQGDAAVVKVMDEAVGLVCPSYADAFPLVMIESYARGTPCVVSNISEAKSFVTDPALIVTPGDVPSIAAAVLHVAEGRVSSKDLDEMQSKARQYCGTRIVSDLISAGAITVDGAP